MLSNSEDHFSQSLYKGYGPAPRCDLHGILAITCVRPFIPELLG